jgi:hypothetical protein
LPASAFSTLGNCRGKSQRLPARARSNLLVSTVDTLGCATMTIPDPVRFGAVDLSVRSSDPDSVYRSVSFSDKRQTHVIAPDHAVAEVPFWATRATLTAIVPPHARIRLNGATMRFLSPGARLPAPPTTCGRSGVRSWEVNPLVYAVAGDIRGTCSVVFRQSFAPVWHLWTRGNAGVEGHFQADGFANGWIVRGSGPVTLYAVNVLIVPYCAGMAITVAFLALTLTLGVRRLARRVAVTGSRRAPSAV